MPDPHKSLITPYSTPEFELMVREACDHFSANADALMVIGAELRKLLPRAKNIQGRAGLMGLDLKYAAKKVGDAFAQGAAAQHDTMAAIKKAHALYLGNFHNPRSGSHGRTFDAS